MTSADDEPALGRRLGALFVDWMIAVLTAAAVTMTPPLWGEDRAPGWVPMLAFFLEVTVLTGLLGFTIGKRLLGLRVIDVDGHPPGLWRAAVRTALLCLVLPALVMTDDKRGLHDLAAGTKVVRA